MTEPPRALGIEGLTDAEEVGRGGFSVVYRAHQPAFDRVVAAKVLNTKPSESGVDRFAREVQAMGQLSEHPGIATVLDAGVTDDGHPYLLMPYFSGGSLDDALQGGTRYTAAEAARIGIRLASALAAAHHEGILHRDIKPANVMLGRYGDPLLVDFGIARIAGGAETTTGVVTATLQHAAPELLDGKRPSVASDIYALGSTLHTLIAGRPPFASLTDESVIPLIKRVITDPPAPLPEGTPDAVAIVIRTALAKEPADRFQDVEAMGRALEAAIGVAPSTAARASAPDAEQTVAHHDLIPPTDRASQAATAPGARRTVMAGGALLLLLVLIGGVVVLRGGGDPAGVSPSVTAADAADDGDDGDEEELEDFTDDGMPLGGLGNEELALLGTSPATPPLDLGDVSDLTPAHTVDLEPGQVTALSFSVPDAGTSLRIFTTVAGGMDPAGALYRDGVLLAADDDGRGDGDVQMDLPDVAPGAYEVRFIALSGAPGPMDVSVSGYATRVLDAVVEDVLADEHAVHVHRVDVRAGGTRGVTVTTDQSIVARLVDARGNDVAVDSGDSEPITLPLLGVDEGSYYTYLSVGEADTAAYTIEPVFGRGSPEPAVRDDLNFPTLDEAARTLEAVGPVDLGVGEVVALPFSVDEPGTVTRATARSADGEVDVVIAIWDGDGTVRATDDDSGRGDVGTDSLIDAPLPPGDYQLVIADLDRDSAGQVDVFVASVPAPPLSPGPRSLDGGDRPLVLQFQVTAETPAPTTVRLEGDADARLRLLDAAGALLEQTPGGGNPPVETAGLPDGTYYLVASMDEAGTVTVILNG